MNTEQVYNILSKRAALKFDAPVQPTRQGDHRELILRSLLTPAAKDPENGADIKVQNLSPLHQIDLYFKNSVPDWDYYSKWNPALSPKDNASSHSSDNKDKKSKKLDKTEGLSKTPEKPGTPDPWSRWGGKLIGGGLGGLGLYGIMSIFTSSPILRALAFLLGAGAGGYMGHTYDAYKARRVPNSRVPGSKTTT